MAMNINMIDIKYAMSNHFKIAELPRNDHGGLKYGFKKLAIVNYVIGIAKTNLNKAKQRKSNKHPVMNFYKGAKYKRINLNADESNIKYLTIAKKCQCSVDMVKKVVQWLKDNKIFNHEQYYFVDPNTGKRSKTNIWFFKLLTDKFVGIFKKLRMISTDPSYKYEPYNEHKKKKWLIEQHLAKQKQAQDQKQSDISAKKQMIYELSGKHFNEMDSNEKLYWIEKINE